MKVMKITDQQLHDLVLHALANGAPELSGERWNTIVNAVKAGAAEMDKLNHLEWSKEQDDAARVDDAAWKLLPYMPGMMHEQVVEKIRSLIKEAAGV